MRVLHVNTAARTGGAAQVASALYRAQRARGQHATFLSGRPEPGGAPNEATLPRARFLANVLAYRATTAEAPLDTRRWRRLLASHLAESDIVHLHNAHGYYLPRPVLQTLLERPCVWTLHDLWLATGRCAAPQGCERWRTGCAPCPHPDRYPAAWHAGNEEQAERRRLAQESRAQFAVPSQWLASCMIEAGVPAERLHVVPNPLLVVADRFDETARMAARRALGWPEDRCVALVAAGWLADPNKNVSMVLEAMARVARPERWFLALLGRPDRTMRRLIAALSVETLLIERTGGFDALAQAYLAADLFLNPSRGESFGMTNLEALAHGCRLICSDLPVFREVAGGAGCYVAPDDTGAWAAALDTALAAWPAAPDMALAAELRRRYALDAVTDAYAALYGLAGG